MPEEETFAVLVKIMQDYRMREMFKPSMAELGLCMYQLDMLVQEHIPDLYGHFQSQSIHTNLYASSWFLTLYTTSLPIYLACRSVVNQNMNSQSRAVLSCLQKCEVKTHLEGEAEWFWMVEGFTLRIPFWSCRDVLCLLQASQPGIHFCNFHQSERYASMSDLIKDAGERK